MKDIFAEIIPGGEDILSSEQKKDKIRAALRDLLTPYNKKRDQLQNKKDKLLEEIGELSSLIAKTKNDGAKPILEIELDTTEMQPVIETETGQDSSTRQGEAPEIATARQNLLDSFSKGEEGATKATQSTIEDKESEENTPEKITERMNELRQDFAKNLEREKNIEKEIDKLQTEKENTSSWKIGKNIKIDKEINKLKRESEFIHLGRNFLAERFNQEERKLFPFAYYIVDKIKNSTVQRAFEREALSTKKGERRKFMSLDRFNSVRNTPGTEIVDPLVAYNTNYEDGVTKQFFGGNSDVNYNMYGLSIESINPEEISRKDDDYMIANLENPKARFKVKDQEGKTLIDKVDYNNARQIYNEATAIYKEKIEKEFANLNNKK